MATSNNISLPISSKQVFGLVEKLSVRDKQKLILYLERETYTKHIPEEHKKLVRKRISKYQKNPEKLISEKEALQMINAM